MTETPTNPNQSEKQKPTPNHRLRRERERRAWSQQELADEVGTTPLNVGRWERGVTLPNPYFRQKLSEVFEKSPYELGLVPTRESNEDIATPSQTPSTSSPSTNQEATVSLWNVPYRRNLFFTGREDILSQLHDAFMDGTGPVALSQPQAVSGLGGIGKTQTAVEYAYRYRDSYQSVFWVRAESSDLLISDYLTLAGLLKLPERNEQDQGQITNAVIRWFDAHDSWLLILDNADELDAITDFIPSAGKGHILLTTRAQAVGTLAQRIDIDKLSLDEGVMLLLRRIKRLRGNTALESVPTTLREQARAIVEAVDGLPLALDQAGAYIEETSCGLSDYLKFYKTHRTKLLRMRGRDVGGHPEPIATTWSLAFENVERANPAAADLLRLCAFLHPDAIPENMLVEGASELGPVLQPVVTDALDLNDAIGALLRYSLVKRDTDTGTLNMHRLVQAVMKERTKEDEENIWIERVVKMMSKVFPEGNQFESWATCQLYLPHAQFAVELSKQKNIQSPDVLRLVFEMALYLNERAQFPQAEVLFQQSLTLCHIISPTEDAKEGEILNAISNLYYQWGKYQEMKAPLERALMLQQRLFGMKHDDVAESLNNLATYYKTQGDNERAIQLLQQAIAIREEVLGEHPHLAFSLLNLAAVYRDQRAFEQAEPLFIRSLAIIEAEYGTIHSQTAHALSSFGGLYAEQKKYTLAEPFFQRALTIKEQILGPDHPQVGLDINNLAMQYFFQGNYEQAEALLIRTRNIFENAVGKESPDVARTIKNIAKLYVAQKRYQEAEILYRQAIEMRKRVLSPSHPLTILAAQEFIALLKDLGRYTEAEELEAHILTVQAI